MFDIYQSVFFQRSVNILLDIYLNIVRLNLPKRKKIHRELHMSFVFIMTILNFYIKVFFQIQRLLFTTIK